MSGLVMLQVIDDRVVTGVEHFGGARLVASAFTHPWPARCLA